MVSKVYPVKELYLYVVDEEQPGMSYNPIALGSAALRRERKTLSLCKKGLNWIGAINKCNLTLICLECHGC